MRCDPREESRAHLRLLPRTHTNTHTLVREVRVRDHFRFTVTSSLLSLPCNFLSLKSTKKRFLSLSLSPEIRLRWSGQSFVSSVHTHTHTPFPSLSVSHSALLRSRDASCLSVDLSAFSLRFVIGSFQVSPFFCLLYRTGQTKSSFVADSWNTQGYYCCLRYCICDPNSHFFFSVCFLRLFIAESWWLLFLKLELELKQTQMNSDTFLPFSIDTLLGTKQGMIPLTSFSSFENNQNFSEN